MKSGSMKPDPLAGLRDIHMPEPVSWWPPAPGWWLLTGLVLLVIAGLVWWLRRRKQQRQKPKQFSQREMLKEAFDELERLEGLADAGADSGSVAIELSALLRRLAIGLKPEDASIAGLSGDDWLSWLDAQWDKHVFSDGVGRALLDAPYQRHSQVDIDQLLPLLRQWIEAQR